MIENWSWISHNASIVPFSEFMEGEEDTFLYTMLETF